MLKIDLSQKKNWIIIISVSVLLIVAIVLAVIFIPNNPDSNDASESIISSGNNSLNNESSSSNNLSNNESSSNVISSKPTVSVNSDESSSSESIVSSGNNSSSNVSSSSAPATKPTVTAAGQVGNNVCVVTGYCAEDVVKIKVTGDSVVTTESKPFAGKGKKYFMIQVPYTASTTLYVTAQNSNGKDSPAYTVSIKNNTMKENYMYRGEYSPVFCKDGRIHYYSALLAYSLNTNKLTSSMVNTAKARINSILMTADSVGAKKTIFLIIPSSADVYPKTVPEEFGEATGERLFERFTKIAEECGAQVIYPLDTLKQHANDGVGYQIYQHTDSHWSTYGSYWGTYDLLKYIANDGFPKAKPRTLKEMDFYTTEMYGGDALYSFPAEVGFEDYYGDRFTKKTQIRELTTRYKLKMPTSTLNNVYPLNVCLYLNEANASSKKEVNPNGEGLPKAIIMRDSFGKVSYDMLNDRFNTVYWGEFNNYNMPLNLVGTDSVDYVIYMYSERNLLKIMMNSPEANILNIR